jgi:hydroxyacylglutathione hydrolase
MRFERIEDPGLAHYSYAVGCQTTGQLAIVDPRRDIDVYERFARREGLTIAFVLETHIHADFASGARELAERTGARLLLSAHDTGEVYEVAFPHEELRDGDTVAVGFVRLEALHTPGHTPEHLSYLVYDTHRSADVPMLMLSGDFLFVGSLGRPDLLGEEAKTALANLQYDSVQRLRGLPDGLEVHPAHGAGSMCGAGMSGRPLSTLGFERIANPYLAPGLSREAFVERLLANVPPFPPYYRRMKRLNAEGPDILGGLPGETAIEVGTFHDLVEAGHVVVDLRDQLSFGSGHVPKAFGIGGDTRLSTWASWVVPYETPILLVAARPEAVEQAARGLIRVGLDDIRGYLDGGMPAWVAAGYPTQSTPQITPLELAERLQRGDDVQVLDVRNADEWRDGHLAGAHYVMGGELADSLDRVSNGDRPVAIICGSGYRSTVAASVLERAGFQNVINVTGGINAWRQAGLPTTRD